MGTKPTQALRILALLRERGSRGATNFELMQISYQYPARIHTLRHKLGHQIEVKHVKDTEWRVTLIKDASRPEPKPEPKPAPEPTTEQGALFDLAPPPIKRRMF